MLKLKPMGRSMWTMVLGLSVLALLGGWYAAWRHFDSPALEQYSALIEQMATHKITGGNDGRVDTSRSFPGLIPGDTAYLTWRDDGSFVVMFPVYFGQGPQLAGLVYTSRPLQDGDTHPREGQVHAGQQLIAAGSYQNLLLDKQINPNWYHVSYHLH